VHEVAARTIGTEANTVVGTAKICLILGVTVDVAHLLGSMGKLTLLAVLASAILLEGTTHLCLVARGLLCRGGDRGAERCLILAADSQGAAGSN